MCRAGNAGVVIPDRLLALPLQERSSTGCVPRNALVVTGVANFLGRQLLPTRRVWVMDRGIPTEEVLKEMRTSGREIFYLVGTPRSKVRQYEKKWLDLPWQKVRESVDVKLFTEDGELYVLAKSEGRRAKERAMRRKKLARLLRKLRAMQRSGPRRDQLLLRIGAARKEAGSAFRFLHLQLPSEGQGVTRHSFQFRVDRAKLIAAELQDGHYLLRSNLVGEEIIS